MELVQTHVGSAKNFWDLEFAQYGHLATEGWVKHPWHALDTTPLSLKGPCLTHPKQRVGDIAIMD